MEYRHIVIVGGGYGGAYLAYKLVSEKIGKVSLIDPKDYSFHCIGALRTAVDPSNLSVVFLLDKFWIVFVIRSSACPPDHHQPFTLTDFLLSLCNWRWLRTSILTIFFGNPSKVLFRGTRWTLLCRRYGAWSPWSSARKSKVLVLN